MKKKKHNPASITTDLTLKQEIHDKLGLWQKKWRKNFLYQEKTALFTDEIPPRPDKTIICVTLSFRFRFSCDETTCFGMIYNL